MNITLENAWEVLVLLITGFILIYHVYLIFFLLLSPRDVTSIYSWLLVLILLPGVGTVIYILFGRYKKEFNIMDKRSKEFIENDLSSIFTPLQERQKEYLRQIEDADTQIQEKKIARLSHNTSSSLTTFNNSVEILENGELKFSKLIEDIQDAKEFIHMEYFIWRNDTLTKAIFEALQQKAKEGVKIRILYDAVGSFRFSLHWRFLREIKRSGIEIYPFLKIATIHAWNYRNHRKIAVIDGKVGYIGGMNMGKEYVDGGDAFARWRDTHLRVEGDAVNLLQRSFAISWHVTTGQSLGKKYFTPMDLTKTNPTPIQVILSGPDADSEAIKQMYFGLITSATKKIYIQTPYFIPDPAMLEAVSFAANAGIDVKIMFTGVPDKKLAWWAAHPYLKAITESGAKVYMYNRGFLHSKVLIADGSISTVGTANFDIRSFRIDYEINAVIYDVQKSQQLEDFFNNDLRFCEEFTLESFNKLNLLISTRNALCRLLSPLL